MDSAMPDIIGVSLSKCESEIFGMVLANWPTFSMEIAEHFKEDLSSRESKRKISTRYSYYLKKLIEKKLIVSKRAGNSLIVWPVLVEKYRTVHQILKET